MREKMTKVGKTFREIPGPKNHSIMFGMSSHRFRVMKHLQSGGATYAHELILHFQRLCEANTLQDIVPKMADLQLHVRDTQAFMHETRLLVGLPPDATLREVLDVLRRFVRAFGLPPRDAFVDAAGVAAG